VIQNPRITVPSTTAPTGFAEVDFLEGVLTGYGVPYDVLRWDAADAARPNLMTTLWDADGSARYSSFAMCVRALLCLLPLVACRSLI
jgi:hypothetical protein